MQKIDSVNTSYECTMYILYVRRYLVFCMHACMYVCTIACLHVYVRIYLCLQDLMYVCMYVCMYKHTLLVFMAGDGSLRSHGKRIH